MKPRCMPNPNKPTDPAAVVIRLVSLQADLERALGRHADKVRAQERRLVPVGSARPLLCHCSAGLVIEDEVVLVLR